MENFLPPLFCNETKYIVPFRLSFLRASLVIRRLEKASLTANIQTARMPIQWKRQSMARYAALVREIRGLMHELNTELAKL